MKQSDKVREDAIFENKVLNSKEYDKVDESFRDILTELVKSISNESDWMVRQKVKNFCASENCEPYKDALLQLALKSYDVGKKSQNVMVPLEKKQQ